MKRNIILATIFFFLCSSLSQAQNFGLVNQNPAQDQVAKDQNNPSQDQATQAYERAQTYIADNQHSAAGQNSRYTLGPTDKLTITVMRHPEVSGSYTINEEGKIQYDFVGDILLSGLTKEEAKSLIVKSLEKYIIRPQVTVVIAEYNSKVVYVVGEVGAPGKIFMRSDTMTVRDALLAANLPQLTAATEKATLFTPSASGKVVLKRVNVYALLYQGDLRENYTMEPGDTLYLPATLWAKVARFLNPITQPIGQAAGAGAAVAAL